MMAVGIAGGLALLAGGAHLLGPSPTNGLAWVSLRFPRDLDEDAVVGFLRALAGDRRRHLIAVEAAAEGGRVFFRLGATDAVLRSLVERLHAFAPGVIATPANRDTAGLDEAWRLGFSTRNRPVRLGGGEVVSRSLLTVLAATWRSDRVVVQWILGPRLQPMAVSNSMHSLPSESLLGSLSQLITSKPANVDSERRRALRDKVAEPGYRATCRIAVSSSTPQRSRSLVTQVLGALRVAEAPGQRLSLARDRVSAVAVASAPRRWPIAVNVGELVALLGWPVGSGEYPGVDRTGSRLLRVPDRVPKSGRVIGTGTHPASPRPLALNARDALQHLHVIGPTGVGKSTLLLNLIIKDIDDGRAVVVVDPKGDLVTDVLARIPPNRRDDVVVLDPADDQRPVGLNPLKIGSQIPELVADQVLAVFHGLYRDNWGPRTQDILHASLLTLVGRPETTLCSLPVLLGDARYRRKVVATIDDHIALRPFWSWFDSISDGERHQAIAPVMNKLRAFLLRPRMRAVIGQADPAFDMTTVFTERKILLVSLAKGLLGPEASALLGSLVVSQFWSATQGRVAIPSERRHPAMCFIDEFQDYLHLPTDLADALAQARGLGLGLTLAHQHLGQLPAPVQEAVLANARSRICFQLGPKDAATFARSVPQLEPVDFQSLDKYQIYASLVADGQVTGYASATTNAPANPTSDPAEIRRQSRQRYGRPIAEIEAALAALLGGDRDPGEDVGRRPRRDR